MNPRRLMRQAGVKMPWKKLLPYLLILMIVALSMGIMFGIVEAIYGLPGFIGIIAVIFGTLITLLIEYPFVKRMLFREFMRQAGASSRRAIRGVIYTVLRTLLAITALIIIVGLLIFALGYSSAGGGGDYFIKQAAVANEVLTVEAPDITTEEVNFGWGDYDDEPPSYENGWGGIIEGVSEADLLVEFALNEAKYYEDTGIKGGLRYWDWARSKGKGLGSGGWEWCANFVSYCIVESGLGVDNDDTFGNFLTCSNILSCYYHLDHYTNELGFEKHTTKDHKDYIPKVGDIIIYCGSLNEGDTKHIGIVAGINGDKVQVVEGNTSGPSGGTCYDRKVAIKEFTYSKPTTRNTDWPLHIYITPKYKSTGAINLNSYEKGSNGYYIDLEQIMFDYLAISKGYSPAVIAGIMSNLSHESGGNYDSVEAGYGKVWTTSNFTTDGSGSKVKAFTTPGSGYNGNWVAFGTNGEYEEALQYPYNFYTDVPIKVGGNSTRRYGMGVGIVQWSQGRRSNYYNFCIANGYDYKGPECLISQLEFLTYELENDILTANQYDKIFNVANSADGAYQSAAYFCHYFERPAGHYSNNSNPSSCPTCHARGLTAKSMYDTYKNKVPSISYGQSTTIPAGTTDISNVMFIGDSNMVRLANTNTFKNVKGVLATVGLGATSWDSHTKSSAGETTIPNSTLKKSIESVDSNKLDHVMIMLGTNDWGIGEDTFKKSYKDILNLIKNRNRNSVITICTILPVNDDYSKTIKSEDVERVNGWIRDIANDYANNGVVLFDLNSNVTISDLSDDGIHLSSIGTINTAKLISTNCR